ncbi:MAG: carbohydrate porin [Planctomycetota bacterium]|nr:MAG: carbohydrate porin [Planctomycetota bacterium]
MLRKILLGMVILLFAGAGLFPRQQLVAAEKTRAPATQPAAATKPTPKVEESGPRPFSLDRPTLTDNWFGLGKPLEDIGIGMKYYWNSHYTSVIKGGRRTDSGKHSATYDWIVTFDLDKMGLIPDAEVLFDARGQWGRSVNPWTGSSEQVIDDADGNRGIYVDMLWYRQHFWDRKLALELGYLDYQTIVDRNVYANSEDKQFMNAALDNNPLIPTAAMTGLGATLYVRPCEWYTMILGVGDAQRLPLYKPGFSTAFHDEAWFLTYIEQTLHTKIPSGNGPLTGNYRFGLLYDPTVRDEFRRPGASPQRNGNDLGFYTSFDQMFYRENPDDNQGLGWFFRYGFRHGESFRFNQFWSTGLVYTGLIPTRDKDHMGAAIAQKIHSRQYRSRINDRAGSETIYELYYSWQATPWLAILPDIQYIDNPGGDNTLAHTIVAGVRMRVTF